MANPLDVFVSKTAPGTVKLPELPNLGEMISSIGFKEGLAKHHESMQEWKRNLEQLLNERLQSKEQVQTGKVQ